MCNSCVFVFSFKHLQTGVLRQRVNAALAFLDGADAADVQMRG